MSEALYLVGDVRQVLATRPDRSIDLLLSSPPFLALRSYLPDGDPRKVLELGSESTPAEFIDAILDIAELARPKLAAHGSLVLEFGDTYSGSGGHGGDYDEGGLRDGQPKFDGSSRHAQRAQEWGYDPSSSTGGRGKQLRPGGTGTRARSDSPKYGAKNRDDDEEAGIIPVRTHTRGQVPGWPLDKSLACIPELIVVALSYGLNPLTGRETPRWRVRNFCPWIRPNPPVGADGDKFRPATSYLIVACIEEKRYFDHIALRKPHKYPESADPDKAWQSRSTLNRDAPGYHTEGENTGTAVANPHGAPQLDWFYRSTEPYRGAHYATWPRSLLGPFIKGLCPERVCRECGRPSERLVTPSEEYAKRLGKSWADRDDVRPQAAAAGECTNHGAQPSAANGGHITVAERVTIGWSECGCGDGCTPTTWRRDEVDVEQGRVAGGKWTDLDEWDEAIEPEEVRTKRKRKRVIDEIGTCVDEHHWRRGLVCDPFAGTGTTGAVATGLGRDALLIDLDPRNIDLALARVGPLFLTVGEVEIPPDIVETELV